MGMGLQKLREVKSTTRTNPTGDTSPETAPATLPPPPETSLPPMPTPDELAALWKAEGWREIDLLPCLPPDRKQIVGGDEERARVFLADAEPHRLVLLEGRLRGWE